MMNKVGDFSLAFFVYNLLNVSCWKVEKRRTEKTTLCFYHCTFRCIKTWLFDKLCHHGTSFCHPPEHHEIYFYYCLLYVGRAVPLESGEYGTSEETEETH